MGSPRRRGPYYVTKKLTPAESVEIEVPQFLRRVKPAKAQQLDLFVNAPPKPVTPKQETT